jgi:hypothetical protein
MLPTRGTFETGPEVRGARDDGVVSVRANMGVCVSVGVGVRCECV